MIFNCAEVVFTGCLDCSAVGVRADPEVNVGQSVGKVGDCKGFSLPISACYDR